ncbi:hypothetical protein DTO271D3_3290 [Paecilomyces variotii]|nr:hypothetical protein DTO271D3_3290 [Paecilomyces variotii]
MNLEDTFRSRRAWHAEHVFGGVLDDLQVWTRLLTANIRLCWFVLLSVREPPFLFTLTGPELTGHVPMIILAKINLLASFIMAPTRKFTALESPQLPCRDQFAGRTF